MLRLCWYTIGERWMNEYGALVRKLAGEGRGEGRKYSEKKEKLVPVPKYPNLTCNGLAGDRTLTSTETPHRLTVWSQSVIWWNKIKYQSGDTEAVSRYHGAATELIGLKSLIIEPETTAQVYSSKDSFIGKVTAHNLVWRIGEINRKKEMCLLRNKQVFQSSAGT